MIIQASFLCFQVVQSMYVVWHLDLVVAWVMYQHPGLSSLSGSDDVLHLQVSTVIGSAVPQAREEQEWTEGVAIWCAVLLVSLVGALFLHLPRTAISGGFSAPCAFLDS
jgi:hypothetical protein